MPQNASDRMEMVVDIYESADAIKGHGLDGDTKKNLQAQHAGFTFLCFDLEQTFIPTVQI